MDFGVGSNGAVKGGIFAPFSLVSGVIHTNQSSPGWSDLNSSLSLKKGLLLNASLGKRKQADH